MEKFKQFLMKNEFEFYENFDISQVSTIKLGATVSIAIFPKTIKGFEKLLCYFYAAKKENKKMEVVGLISIITSLVFAYAAK